MKATLRLLLTLVLVGSGALLASAQQVIRSGIFHSPRSFESVHSTGTSETMSAPLTRGVPLAAPLSVSINGANVLPVSGFGHQPQSDGRALHNIQVDPSNPLNVHAVIMQLSSTDPKDTNLLSRRIYYVFSHDGGKTWGSPVMLGDVRTGFACMILYKRGNDYVPIIAAHRNTNPGQTPLQYECALWVEKGAPGAGNFQMTECGRLAADHTNKDILWPYIAVSPEGDRVYMVGSVSVSNANLSDFMEFGYFDLTADGTATWNGWSKIIGNLNGNHTYAGMAQTGDYVLRVSPAGKVGLLWRSSDYSNPEPSLYLIESTDRGASWPTDFDPIFAVSGPDQNNIWDGPWTGLDFYYPNEFPRVLYTETFERFDQLDASGNPENVYYPSECRLHFWNSELGQDTVLVTTFQTDAVAQYSLYDAVAPYPVGSSIKEGDSWISYPTLGHTDDPRFLVAYYESFPSTDSVKFNDTTWHLYGTIYYQVSMDGGAVWSAPTPLQQNNQTPGAYGKLDFRAPQVSDWNPVANGNFQPVAMYTVDTAAGEYAIQNGASDWDVENFFEQTQQFSDVPRTQGAANFEIRQNYPNPFNGKTSVEVDLNESAVMTLTVTDVLGRTIATLGNGRFSSGAHSFNFDGSELPAGVYRCLITIDGKTYSRTMSLVK